MISKSFVEYWSKKFDESKYPPEFFAYHSARLAAGMPVEEFKETLIALLHWKDGKADLYSPISYTAKPNIINPVKSLELQQAQNLMKVFFEFRAQPELTDRGLSFYNYLQRLWRTTVIPVFIMHIARPTEVPIVDQHVIRAIRFLRGNSLHVQNTDVTWTDFETYYDFFVNAVAESDLDRRLTDMALWAWGKELKRFISPNEGEKTTDNEPTNIESRRSPDVPSNISSATQNQIEDANTANTKDNIPSLWGQDLSASLVPTNCNIRTALEHLLASRRNGPNLKSWESQNLRQLGADRWPDEIISEILKDPGGIAAQSALQEFKSEFKQSHVQNDIPRCIRDAFFVGVFSQTVSGKCTNSQFVIWSMKRNFGGTENAAAAIYQVGKTAGQTFGLLSIEVKPTDLFHEYFEV
jgi:hypothetical protein